VKTVSGKGDILTLTGRNRPREKHDGRAEKGSSKKNNTIFVVTCPITSLNSLLERRGLRGRNVRGMGQAPVGKRKMSLTEIMFKGHRGRGKILAVDFLSETTGRLLLYKKTP